MVAYSFKAQFAEPILDGTKGGTIRADRKRHARPGEELQLYSGMRTRQCRLIARKTCLAIYPIALAFHADKVAWPGRRLLGASELDAFAHFDGFADWLALRAFWLAVHEELRLFEGQHIRWLELPKEIAQLF